MINNNVLCAFLQSGGKKGRGNVDSLFWARITKLTKIVLPDWSCKEARYIYLLTGLLIVRTMMSIWLADVNGKVVKAIVNKSFPEFLKRVSMPILQCLKMFDKAQNNDFNLRLLCVLLCGRFSTYFCSPFLHR